MTTFADFQKLDMRLGKIVAVELLPNAKYTTHKLTIDFGEFGIKKSSVQIVALYKKEELLLRQIV